ncbi:Down syndrome cell adhesion molecule homolog [Stylophora pistillata]|uniref:Down syndrome cell adhesion molecule homolog n=1 Tax=Stylophora pistillata TaxID=50429 RepID=UPI000C0509BE|nr:Down syndrome cell adhesion molecule homolog [Stylophora pistillata]
MTNEIISNVTRFYEGIRVTVTVNEFRNGSVIADFTIIYNVSDYKLIERLQQNISSTGFLYNMPLEVEEFTAENVPEVAPTNISVLRVEDTSIHIRWNSLSLPPSISAIFQGYKVFIRSVGRADVIVTTVTVNDLVNFVTIKGLESLVTYNLTVAGYTLSGVGRESESFSVTTPLDDPPEDISVERVTSNCVQIKWGGLPPEKLAAFDGYRVFYALFSHPTFSLNTTVNSSTHRVEICSLESSMKYKFYVQRILRKDVGNASDVKYFTTEIVMRLAPTNVTCRNTSSTSIEVHWAPPSVEVNSLEIIGYDLHFRPHGLATELWSTLLACNRTLSATIKSLEKYTEYDIRVTIFITNGRGNFSEIVRCFTDEDIPLGGPVNISAENTSSTGINISWSPVPETLRLGIINKYIFNITDLLTGYLRTIEFDGPSLNGEVRNLSKYQEYSVQGAAVNSKGRSNFTNAIT